MQMFDEPKTAAVREPKRAIQKPDIALPVPEVNNHIVCNLQLQSRAPRADTNLVAVDVKHARQFLHVKQADQCYFMSGSVTVMVGLSLTAR